MKITIAIGAVLFVGLDMSHLSTIRALPCRACRLLDRGSGGSGRGTGILRVDRGTGAALLELLAVVTALFILLESSELVPDTILINTASRLDDGYIPDSFLSIQLRIARRLRFVNTGC
jgi:hypothetical protein